MPLSDGQKFAGYTIVRLLGSGGMGEVYLAEHPRLPRRDALKILPLEVSADEEYRARFEREADLASTLWHPHIVGVHDRGEADGQLWISMDFVDGRDASQLLGTKYPVGMPPDEVAAIVNAIAGALDYAHKQGLMHRDVKPANIMLTHVDDDGEKRILLADFGIARTLDDISGLTATNMTVGTVAYTAPEQLMGEDIDGRADQYALAATAYHLLTGTTLFPHTNPAVIISRHLNAEPPPISRSKPDLASLDSVLAAALSKDPADRFTRCSDFAQALAEQVGSSGPRTGAPTTSASAVQKPAPHRIPSASKSSATSTQHAAASKSPPPPSLQARRTPLIIGGVLATVLLVVLVGLVWKPWETTQTRTSQTSSTTAPVALPQAPATSVSPPAASTPTSTAAPDPNRYALPGCYFPDSPPTERPAELSFQTCADGSNWLESMSWSSWGSAGAQGKGIFSFKTCEPNCAEGPRAQYAVNVSAFDPRPAAFNSGCPTDVLFYNEMILSFPASPPDYAETTYLGRPAIRFSPEESGAGALGNQLCY